MTYSRKWFLFGKPWTNTPFTKKVNMNSKLIYIVLSLAFLSCSKKNWTCTCTNDTDGSIFEVSNYDLTESDAVSACANRDNEPNISCTLEEI